MGLHLRRRRKLESVPTGAVPPADGNAPCLDAYSRRWGTQPIAGRFVDAVLAALPEPSIESVRLNLLAQRPR